MSTQSVNPVPDKPQLLALCDHKTLEQVAAVVRTWFDVVHVRDGPTLLYRVEQDRANEIATVIVDVLRDDSQAAVKLLDEVSKRRASVRRVLMTTTVDLSVIISGLHSGIVEKIVYKPINAMELAAAVYQPTQSTIAHAAASQRGSFNPAAA